MPTLIHRRVREAQQGTNPKVIRKVRSGWIVLGDSQFLRGYCVLLPDPVVPTLNDLPAEARTQYLDDLAALGDAILEVTGAVRINYSILCNLEPALHAHAHPRYADEPEAYRTASPFSHPQRWEQDLFDAVQHRPIMDALGEALDRAGRSVSP